MGSRGRGHQLLLVASQPDEPQQASLGFTPQCKTLFFLGDLIFFLLAEQLEMQKEA